MSDDAKRKASEEEKKITLGLMVLGLALIPVLVAVAFNGHFAFLARNVKVDDLALFSDKLEFTVRYYVLIGAWLAFLVIYTATKRVQSDAAVDTLNEPRGPHARRFIELNQILRN